jgi:diguanylate cyclase (GGDEF)-like protein/PAS domain S-box-containing protein
MRVAWWLGLAVMGAGLLVLWGWAQDIDLLKTFRPDLVPMRANAAAGFVLCGASLWLRVSPRGLRVPRLVANGCAGLAGAIALLTLLEYGFGWTLGIDQMLVTDPSGQIPGRMAVMTAVDFVLLAAALWLLDVESPRGLHPSNWLALGIAANAFLAILGYLYDVEVLYRISAVAAMALHTAILFVLASVGVALARPTSVFVGRLLSADAVGLLTRRLLPAAVVVPPLLGWLVLRGQNAGYYGPGFSLALFVSSIVAMFSTLVWWSAAAIRHLRKEQRTLAETSDWQQAILDSANFTMISTDPAGLIRTINAGVADKLGYAPEELVGKHTPQLIHDKDEVVARAEVLSRELGRCIEPGFEVLVAKARMGQADENDWTYITKHGERFPVRLSVTAITNDGGDLTGFLGVGYDITLQKQAEAKLMQLAQSDSLTGLANRLRFEDWLQEAIARSAQRGDLMALLFIDVDHFKAINDSLGHHGGDLVLQELARRLLGIVRTTDLVARLAGDEFVIVLQDIQDRDQACVVADMICVAMRTPFRVLDVNHPVSVSIGIALREQQSSSSTQLLRHADQALYQAKDAGRGRYQVYA